MNPGEKSSEPRSEGSNIPTPILALLALVFWISAIGMAVIGFTSEDLSFLRWAAIPDGIAALVTSFFAIRRSIGG